ncbi:MAG: 50S ribosomal protein L11 methyltransferase [Gemmatimonadota bacterium]
MSTGVRWLVVEVRAPSEALTAALAEGLVLSGGSAVEEVDGALRTWLPDPLPGGGGEEVLDATPRAPADAPPGVGQRLAEVSAALAAAVRQAAGESGFDSGVESGGVSGGDPPIGAPAIWTLRWWWQPEEDWGRSWCRGLGARRVGSVVVAPTWVEAPLEPGEVLVRIDPKMAFGTGEHPTTRGTLRLLQQAAPAGAAVLDVGAGSAVLAIAAARLGAAAALAVEADGDAIDNALENVALNGVADRVEVAHARVDAAWLAERRAPGWDLILANVLSSVLVPLLAAFRAALAPGGRLVLSGILATEAAAVQRAATEANLVLHVTDVEGEWWSGLFRPAGASGDPVGEGGQGGA